MDYHPNPFADEPLPVKGQRLESVANPLNPYAAPASAEEYNPNPPPGIGLWRDGPLLVMHVDARFPERCLFTGRETSERRGQNLPWNYPIDWTSRTLKVEYGLSPVARARIGRRRNIGILVAIVAALILILPALIPDRVVRTISGSFMFIFVIAIVAGLHFGLDAGRVLKFRKVKYPYLWVKGAEQPFLDTLPQWPGIG